MSSITDRRGERGQALVIFTGAMVALALVAALAFDIGMIMLERRDQQNAADAAALAGARCLVGSCNAVARATDVATLNGFTTGATPGEVVTVVAGNGRIQVNIYRELPSLFAGVVGRSIWPVGALAVAINATDAPPFASMIALSPDACPAFKITGTGAVNTNGDIQVNSACSETTVPAGDAFLIAGSGTLTLDREGLACYVVGDSDIQGQGGSEGLCNPPQQGYPISWPLGGMPSNTEWPEDMVQVSGPTLAIPDGCPGGVSAPETTGLPAVCQFNGTKYDATAWRFYPGYYPGGIKLQVGTMYFEPGIYHIAGGGITVVAAGGGNLSITSVQPGTTNFGGGVLFFNTTHETAVSGGITFDGNGGDVRLWPLGGIDENCEGASNGWNRYLIFQDPAVTNDIKIQGGGNVYDARGLILAPTADVTVNGGTGTLTIDAIIANTFKINGEGGTINVLYDNCAMPTFNGYGLIV